MNSNQIANLNLHYLFNSNVEYLDILPMGRSLDGPSCQLKLLMSPIYQRSSHKLFVFYLFIYNSHLFYLFVFSQQKVFLLPHHSHEVLDFLLMKVSPKLHECC
jgi:hypothetical protein